MPANIRTLGYSWNNRPSDPASRAGYFRNGPAPGALSYIIAYTGQNRGVTKSQKVVQYKPTLCWATASPPSNWQYLQNLQDFDPETKQVLPSD